MKRISISLTALACALTFPAAAMAVDNTSAGPAVVTHATTGTVTNIGYANFTIQLPGREVGVINAMIGRANEITRDDYPYVWGGGHAEAGVASVGMPGGPGYNGHTKGFDCSGSVAAVLVGGGLWPAGAGVPGDAGVISELLQNHIIARGAGTGPNEVTLYDDPGVHIFMNIDGRFFGTSDGDGVGNKKGGPGWLDDTAYDAWSSAYKEYHVLASVLRETTSDAQAMTFQIGRDPMLIDGFADGDKVNVTYSDASNGVMIARSVGFYGLHSVSGTITKLSRHSVVITTAHGSMTFAAPDLPSGLVVADTVAVTYTRSGGVDTLRSISVTATSTPPPGTPPSSASATSGTGLTKGAWTGWGGWVRGSRRAAAHDSSVAAVSRAAG